MKGDGNGLETLIRKLFFFCIPTSNGRTKWIVKNKIFANVGKDFFWQPRKLPADPELISFGNNVNIASNVTFINHDIIGKMLKKIYNDENFKDSFACIEVGDNVMIGTGTVILPNVKIGSNVIIGAGTIVTKDVSDNIIIAGNPARKIGEFNDLVEKRRFTNISTDSRELWEIFRASRE